MNWRFLLVAPVDRARLAPTPLTAAAAVKFESRFSASPEILRQTLTKIPPPVLTGGPPGHPPFWTVTQAWISQVQSSAYGIFEVVGRTRGMGTSDLESSLSDVARRAASMLFGPDTSVPWVGRLVLGPANPTPDWILGSSREAPLGAPRRGSRSRRPRLIASWGNGRIGDWTRLTDEDQTATVMGLVDAQFIWRQMDQVSASCSEGLKQLTERGAHNRIPRAILRRNQVRVEEITDVLARHHLASDDIVLNIQGVRSIVASTLLDAWGYEDAEKRVTRQLAEMSAAVEIQAQRVTRRSQGVIEYVLAVLGAFTLIDLCISLVGLAFDKVESTPSGVGLLRWVVDTGGEGILVASIVAFFLVSIAFGVVRRNA